MTWRNGLPAFGAGILGRDLVPGRWAYSASSKPEAKIHYYGTNLTDKFSEGIQVYNMCKLRQAKPFFFIRDKPKR